jgi:predicted phage tail component-like protein
MRDETYFSIIFGDGSDAVDIGKLFDGIIEIKRNPGAGQEHTFSAGTGRFGKSWLSSKRGSYPISIKGVKYGSPIEFLILRNKLAIALDCPNGPKKLLFDDYDNKYFLALTSGEPDFSENIDKNEVVVTINFIVPDGLIHSEVTKVLDRNTTNQAIGSMTISDKVVKMTINNEGSAPAYPKIRIRNNSDNGWIGIVNKNGLMEIGTNTSNVSGSIVSSGQFNQSETLLDIRPNDRDKWSRFRNVSNLYSTVSPLPFARYAEISPEMTMGWLAKGIGGQGYPAPGFHWLGTGHKGIGQDWGTCIYEYELPADKTNKLGSKDFRCDFNIKLWASKFGQTGSLGILFMTKDNKFICGYNIEKYDTSTDLTVQTFTTYDLHNHDRREENTFGSNNNEPGQNRPNIAFNYHKGDAFVIKEGPKFTFSYNGVPKSVVDGAKEHLECAKIWIWAGRFRGERADVKYLDTLVLQSIRFSKTNMERYDLIPNKYVQGSEVVVDLYEGKISFVASPEASKVGVSAEGDLIKNSRYFSVPPGVSNLEIHSSDFITSPPDVTVEWNESWL